jgi:hypothetical protein
VKLIKTVEFQNEKQLIAEWEEAVRKIEKLNKELKNNAPVLEVEGWEAYEIFWLGTPEEAISDLPTKIANASDASALGLRLEDMPASGTKTLKGKYGCSFSVAKAVLRIKQKSELLSFPDKLEFKRVSEVQALAEAQKIGSYLNIEIEEVVKIQEGIRKSDYRFEAFWRSSKVFKVESGFCRGMFLGDPDCFFSNHYRKAYRIVVNDDGIKVFEGEEMSQIRICEAEMAKLKNGQSYRVRVPSAGGGSTQTSMESDGFWNK